jgi:hypothetical protein
MGSSGSSDSPASVAAAIATQAVIDSATYAPVAVANVFTAKQTVPALQLSTAADAMTLNDTLGTGSSRRLSLQPANAATSTKSAQIELVPGTLNDSATSVPSQILLYNKVGNNYERFSMTCQGNRFLIESTYNGTGLPRDLRFEMGGSDSNAITGQSGLVLYNDASVDLQGGTYSLYGKTWGATRTRVADPGNTGDSRLIIDTRTQTPADNVADSCSIDWLRGGVPKWHEGLNYAGGNTDAFQFYSQMGAGTVLELAGGATAKIGFLGAPAVARAAAITTPTAPSAAYVQAEAAAMKTAVDAIRVALTNIGITA